MRDTIPPDAADAEPDRLLPMLAPEFRLLCLAVRPKPDRTALGRAIAEGPDWIVVLDAARRHRVGAVFLAALQPLAAEIPPHVLRSLLRQTRETALRSLGHAAEVARLAAGFAASGIRVLVLKGVVLSQQLHGDLVSRGAGDIDLLVAAPDFWAADALLRGAGYEQLGEPLSEGRKIAGQHLLCDLTYRRGDIVVELHQRFAANPHCLPTRFEALWAARETVVVAGAAVATLPRRVLPLYLCVHGALHCWQRLRWLLDLALLLQDPRQAALIMTDAAELGLDRPMRLAAALASGMLGIGTARSTPAAERFCRRFYAGERWRMQPEGGVAWTRRVAWMRFYSYGLKGTWAHAWTDLVAELKSPADWAVLPLPDRLLWLYPVLRPLGWVLRKLRRRPDGR